VVAQGTADYCICLVTPNQQKMIELLSTDAENQKDLDNLGKLPNGTNEKNKELQRIIEQSGIVARLEKETMTHSLKSGLNRFEIPTKLKFVSEIWLPDSGLVTDSLKLKRKAIETFYEKEIVATYK
jgi:long-chain acyl-CoA synthetase